MPFPQSLLIVILDPNSQASCYPLALELMTLDVQYKISLILSLLLIDNGPMAIDAGRHPILETIHNDFVVRNSLFSIIRLLVPD